MDNSKCYTFEEKTYNVGLFDKSIDATYIIHLVNNGRKAHIEQQLSVFQPTKCVYIVNNKGFKNCNKKLVEQISYQDLTDAFLQCFKHANDKGYENILILEDDFIFSPEIKDLSHIKIIDSFLSSKKNEEFIYYLGCVPVLVVPYDLSNYLSLKSCATHSVVYSKKAREKKINIDGGHWDFIIENNYTKKFLYYKPLCYQIFPETENKQNWHYKDHVVIIGLKDFFIYLLELNKKPEFGFSVIYFVSKFVSFLILIIFCCLLYTLIMNVNKIKKTKIFTRL